MKYELKVPTSLNEITLGQYQQYLKLPDGLTENQIALKMVNIFCNVPDIVVRNIKAADIQRIVETLTKMFNETPALTRQFKLGGKKYGFIPNLDNMSFGEYIDIDTYLGDWDNIEKAMAVLYRPIQGKYDKLYNIEPYEAKDALEYKFMPLGVVLGSYCFFLQFRERIVSGYDGLFTLGGNDLSTEANFGAKWGWYQSIFGLAHGDITRFENITKLNMHECLYVRVYEREKRIRSKKN
jgi:hypothetical protein